MPQKSEASQCDASQRAGTAQRCRKVPYPQFSQLPGLQMALLPAHQEGCRC